MEPLPLILQYVKSLGHAIFTDGAYNLNIIGVRTRKGAPDSFDDRMMVAYKDELGWVVRCWAITTEPGLYYLQDKSKWFGPEGVAVLVEGQYRSVYKIDLHGGKYLALCQRNGSVKLYRDANLDAVIDYKPESIKESSSSGINLHASNSTPYDGDQTAVKVGPWSAGCQVFANESDFREFMAICQKQVGKGKGWDTFTYTLVREPEGFNR